MRGNETREVRFATIPCPWIRVSPSRVVVNISLSRIDMLPCSALVRVQGDDWFGFASFCYWPV